MDEFTREHRFFVRAAQNAIEVRWCTHTTQRTKIHGYVLSFFQVYMDLFDRPKGGSGAGTAEEDAMANLSESERKKLLSKQRRAQRRADEAKALGKRERGRRKKKMIERASKREKREEERKTQSDGKMRKERKTQRDGKRREKEK